MLIEIFKLVLGFVALIISGMFDAQKDYAKSSIARFVNRDLYQRYPFYFYSGNGENSGWVFKWKNGKHSEGEAFRGSNTYNVYKTDWFHFAKKLQILFLVIAGVLITSVNPFFILAYEFINHFGFTLAVSNNKYSNLFMKQFHKLGLYIFLRTQNKYNKELLNRYISNKN